MGTRKNRYEKPIKIQINIKNKKNSQNLLQKGQYLSIGKKTDGNKNFVRKE